MSSPSSLTIGMGEVKDAWWKDAWWTFNGLDSNQFVLARTQGNPLAIKIEIEVSLPNGAGKLRYDFGTVRLVQHRQVFLSCLPLLATGELNGYATCEMTEGLPGDASAYTLPGNRYAQLKNTSVLPGPAMVDASSAPSPLPLVSASNAYDGLFEGEKFAQDDLTDVQVSFGQRVFWCHMVVLCRVSPVWKTELTIADMTERHDRTVDAFDDKFTVQEFAAFLGAVYDPAAVNAMDTRTLCSTYRLADKYDVQSLLTITYELLLKTREFTYASICPALDLALTFGTKDFLKLCLDGFPTSSTSTQKGNVSQDSADRQNRKDDSTLGASYNNGANNVRQSQALLVLRNDGNIVLEMNGAEGGASASAGIADQPSREGEQGDAGFYQSLEWRTLIAKYPHVHLMLQAMGKVKGDADA